MAAYYAEDSEAGDTNGQGVNDDWSSYPPPAMAHGSDRTGTITLPGS